MWGCLTRWRASGCCVYMGCAWGLPDSEMYLGYTTILGGGENGAIWGWGCVQGLPPSWLQAGPQGGRACREERIVAEVDPELGEMPSMDAGQVLSGVGCGGALLHWLTPCLKGGVVGGGEAGPWRGPVRKDPDGTVRLSIMVR